MDLKTLLQMSMCVWFFGHFIFDAKAAEQRSARKKSGHPDRQMISTVLHHPHVYRNLRTEARRKFNKLSLSTFNLKRATSKSKMVRRKHAVKFEIQQQGLKKSEINKTFTLVNRIYPITPNAFIDFDMRRAFVPKRILSKKSKSDVYTNKAMNNTHKNQSIEKTGDLNKTSLHQKDFESNSESLNIDKIVIDKIQQLENELTLMKNQVKNDTDTIHDLKSKVLQKDKELNEFVFTNQSLSENKITNTTTLIEDFSIPTRIQMSIKNNSKIKRKRSTKVQKETTENSQLYVPNRILFRKNTLHRVSNSDTEKKNYYNKDNIGEAKSFNNKTKENLTKIKDHKKKYTNILENQEIGKKQFVSDPHIKDTEPDYDFKKYSEMDLNFDSTTAYKDISIILSSEGAQPYRNLDKLQIINKTKINDPTEPLQEDLDYDRFNVSDKNVNDKEDYGYINPGNDGFGIMRKNDLMNYDEYQKKLDEERIQDGIDWKNFNPQKFLSQLSSEIKARSIPTPEYENLPQMTRNSGRRMISNNTFNLTNADSLTALNNDDQRKYTEHLTTHWHAPAPPGERKLIMTTFIPDPTEPLPSNLNEFNADDDVYSVNDFSPNLVTSKTADETPENMIPKKERRYLAPAAGKQKIILDSTELLVRNFLGRLNKGRSKLKKPYDFEVFKQRINRESGKRRQMLHERIAHRMTQKISGRRNMDQGEIVYDNYDSQELLKDPFLNDSYI